MTGVRPYISRELDGGMRRGIDSRRIRILGGEMVKYLEW